jgi:hypothetical protein
MFIGAAAAALVTGLWAGLQRLGLPLPDGLGLGAFHGALMVSGFLGTVISLERAVIMARWWGYAAPTTAAAGASALIAGAPTLAAVAFLFAAAALLASSVAVAARQPALFTVMPAVAAACWGVGTLASLIDVSMRDVAGWWLAFLVLTIAAERLELSCLLAPPRLSRILFALIVGLILICAARGELAARSSPFTGLGFLSLAGWLVRYDVARRTIHQAGQPRFSAACMMAGYGWLAAAGLLLLVNGPDAAAFSFDAALHAITIGFVLSMAFGHAPIILTSVTGISLRINTPVYLPLALLHLSLLLRIAGDLMEWTSLRALSGPVTLLSLAGYGALLMAATYSPRAYRHVDAPHQIGRSDG